MTFVDVASRYELGTRIATGGMGEVWRATDTVLDRAVAIKLLKREYADDAGFRARFAEEARHAAALHHPNVASIFDFGEALDPLGHAPLPFLVMELVEGVALSSLIQRGVPMPPETAVSLLSQAALGVAEAHAAGIVHRDLKPANLLVTPEGQVKITDFGIARAADGVALTQTGQILGSPHYLSPEQADGRSATPASDVYALGVVLYECLTGNRPFTGDGAVATALAHLSQPVPELPADVPAALRDVVRRALAKDPGERYVDAAAFGAALREPEPTVRMSLPPATVETVEPTVVLHATAPSRRPRWWWVAIAVIVAVLCYVIVSALSDGGTQLTPDQPTNTPTTSAPAGITLNEADYLGRRLADVTIALEAEGLTVDPVRVTNADGHPERTVSDVSPLSGLQAGDTVVVSFWGPTPPTQNPPHGHSGKGKGHKK